MAFVGGPSTEGPGSVSQKFFFFNTTFLSFIHISIYSDAVNVDVKMASLALPGVREKGRPGALFFFLLNNNYVNKFPYIQALLTDTDKINL